VDKNYEKDAILRDIGEAVCRIERHRSMFAELVSIQSKALLDLKRLLAKSDGTAPEGTRLPDVDDEVRRTSLAGGLVSGKMGIPKRPNPKVLLVDDDPTTRNLISHFLRTENFIVEKASGGSDGLAKARSGKPDLLIVDAAVPGMNGFEVLSALKKDPETSGIPVLMLSSLNEEEEIVKSLDEGADYVIKPFSPRILVANIKKILREACDHAVDRRPL
jgi:PleD family two-component response regulator